MEKSGISLIARVLGSEGKSGQPSLARGFRLGPWQVRPDLCTLEGNDKSVALEPKTMGVLLCLAQHAPKVVTRDQFIAEVWNGRIVTDEVLSRAISLLRSQLGDDPHEPRFVRTVPRVGYALLATVEVPPAPDQPPGKSRARWPWAVAAGAAALLLLAAVWLVRDRAAAPAGPARIAVLPLSGSVAGASDTDFADALTEELTISLSRAPGLRVVARNSALRFTSDADPGDVADALGATHVLTGSVRTRNERLRVTVHLAEAATGTELWADTYDRDFGELFGVQADISSAVTDALRRSLSPGVSAPPPPLAERPPANPEAYRLYLQGRQQLARRGSEGLRAAVGLLEQAVAADPGFLRAHFALAWACTLLPNVAPAETPKAVACADRALAMAARETALAGEVQGVRAWLELERNHWSAAETAFRAALAATPDETEMRLLYSQMLGALGKREQAEREAHQALANDPLSPAALLRLAVLRLWVDDDREAAKLLGRARDLDLAPSAAPEVPMLLYVRHGEVDRLEQALRDVQRQRGQSDAWVAAAVAALEDPARGAAAEAALEKAAVAGEVDGLMHFGALVLAGRDERALRWLLERPRLRTRELEFAMYAREADGLRRLPGFHRLATQFGLDGYWDRYGWPPQCARAGGSIRCD
jgi:TolB-like protein/DNA-binding winged helix-turn-helix (wHTH) protein/tetratricopeptide (TPR) repeat protein